MKNYLSTLLIACLITPMANAQNWSLGVHMTYDNALQEYDKNLDNNPIGISFAGIYTPKNSRLSYGVDLGVAMYYMDTYREDLSERGYDGASAEVYEEDCYFTYNAFARYNMGAIGPITPYAELRIGGASYFTSKDYSDFSGSNAPRSLESDFDVHGTSLKTGAGGGLVLNFGMLRKEPRKGNFSLDFGVTANNGSRVNYRSIRESNAAISNSSSYYNSKTDNIVYRLGVLIDF